jgi:branched-chain amino acid transport system permease protein
MAVAMFTAAFALDQDDGGTFVSFLAFIGTIVAVASEPASWVGSVRVPATQARPDPRGLLRRVRLPLDSGRIGREHVDRHPGDDLRGHRDGTEHRRWPGRSARPGYIAFLGSGAFVAAVLSRSAFSTVDVHPPFIVVVLISGAVAATLGLIIGSPTLRVSGDYLAIVTLAFGEIFRISMNNLDGENGPNLTRAQRHPGNP